MKTVSSESASFHFSTEIFLRGLGAIYFIAFTSYWVQFEGLHGSSGIAPIQATLDYWSNRLGLLEALYRFPSLFWISSGSLTQNAVLLLGTLSSITLILGKFSKISATLAFLFYLSITAVGQPFSSFQWDALLLECGFIAIILAPTRGFQGFRISRLGIFLIHLLIFRLMFSSGAVKLLSEDPNWHHFKGLLFHFETQPLPNTFSAFFHFLPRPVLALFEIITFLIEIVLPFFIFFGNCYRKFVFAGLVILQIMIFVSGNYTYFNLLTILLCIPLLDDTFFRRATVSVTRIRASEKWVVGPLLYCHFILLLELVLGRPSVPELVSWPKDIVRPIRVINHYGLFSVMTTVRDEIIIEGSLDGRDWRPYEFRYKPGAVDRSPPFIAPHQPRLDWQMWFAALRRYDDVIWFQVLLVRLLENSSSVIGLLEKVPFEEAPKFIRAERYRYQFDRDGVWKRERVGPYSRVLSLRKPNQDDS